MNQNRKYLLINNLPTLLRHFKTAKDFENFNIHEFTLKIGKLIKCPFYLGSKPKDSKTKAYIKVYDSKVAMMISLYGSNLQDYIIAMETKNERR